MRLCGLAESTSHLSKCPKFTSMMQHMQPSCMLRHTVGFLYMPACLGRWILNICNHFQHGRSFGPKHLMKGHLDPLGRVSAFYTQRQQDPLPQMRPHRSERPLTAPDRAYASLPKVPNVYEPCSWSHNHLLS